MRTRSFAYAFARQLLAVALSGEEFKILHRGTRLTRAPLQRGTKISWYLIGKGRIDIKFARWCVTHWRRTFGFDPRSPSVCVKHPTLQFLQNYSVKGQSYSGCPRVGRDVLHVQGYPEIKQDDLVGEPGLSGLTSAEDEEAVELHLLPETVQAQLRQQYLDGAFGPIAFGY
jgi:hypothetical protein